MPAAARGSLVPAGLQRGAAAAPAGRGRRAENLSAAELGHCPGQALHGRAKVGHKLTVLFLFSVIS